MSGNVQFAVAATSGGAEADPTKPRPILPYEVLENLQGRRVTLLLSVRGEELEGTLRTVAPDRGDLFLDDVVHYVWSPSAEATGAEWAAAPGGGTRRVVARCRAAMVSSHYVDVITPTVGAE